MEDTSKPGYIDKESHQNTSYDKLYVEGIEMLQNLSGAQWTDFNEHDPGVTILENLVYAITELEHKADLPIEHILRESKGKALQPGDNGFFLPSEILTTAPITENDYRKLFVDQVKNLKNVWIKSQQEYNNADQLLEAHNGLRGLYHIYVELYDYPTEAKALNEEKQRVHEAVKQLFHANRNFCEDLYGITIQEPTYIDMNLQLTLEEHADGEQVFSEVFYMLSNYISSDIEFAPLWKLVEEGMSTNAIFNGPMLNNGFITDAQLKEKPEGLALQPMEKMLARIDGVVSVDFFELNEQKEGLVYIPILQIYLEKNNQQLKVKGVVDNHDRSENFRVGDVIIGVNKRTFSSAMALLKYVQNHKYILYKLKVERGREAFPMVIKPHALHFLPIEFDRAPLLSNIDPERQKDLFFKSKGEYFFLDLQEFKEHLEEKRELNLSTFKSATRSFNEMGLPEGENLQLNAYYPLRKQFPVAYGIGDFGLPEHGISEKRKAQAKQLKAYLMPLDQMMANFLKQLTSLYALYDVNETKNLTSYFYQELDDMPELLELVKEYHLEPDKTAMQRWEKTLAQLNDNFDHGAVQRLNEVADTLLARFGEVYPSYTLKKINGTSYGNKGHDASLDKEILFRKRELIKHYDAISYNRAVAYNYLQEASDVPSLIRIIAVLLDINSTPQGGLAKAMTEQDSGFGIFWFEQRTDFIGDKLSKLFGTGQEDVIAADELLIIEERVYNISDDFFFFSNDKNVLNNVLKMAVIRENYQIKETNNHNDPSCYILFTNEERMTNVVHKSSSKAQAKIDIATSIAFIKSLSQKSEGLYYVEHMLLAPPYLGRHFGFKICIKNNNEEVVCFQHYQLENYQKRNKWVKRIHDNIKNPSGLQFRVNRIENKYVIRILDDGGTIIAQSIRRYAEETEAHTMFGAKRASSGRQNLQICTIEFISNYGKGNYVEESFFSFQISFMLPSWPVRFQDLNFRSKLNDLLHEHAPAHIAHQSYWLDVEDMADFEFKYGNWKSYLSQSSSVEERLKHAYTLIDAIKKYQGQ